MDLEFVMERGQNGYTCVMTQTPTYVRDLAECFPEMHFLCYCGNLCDYNPATPHANPIHIAGNLQVTSAPFTPQLAYEFAKTGYPLLLISYFEPWERQVVLHCCSQAVASFMIVGQEEGSMLEGEFVLPLYGNPQKHVLFLVASQPARGRKIVDINLLKKELTYFNTFVRYVRFVFFYFFS
jgi:hypothetical protein